MTQFEQIRKVRNVLMVNGAATVRQIALASRNPIYAWTMTEPLKMANYWTATYRPGVDATNNIPSRVF